MSTMTENEKAGDLEELKQNQAGAVPVGDILYTDKQGRSLTAVDLQPPEDEQAEKGESEIPGEARVLWEKGRTLGSKGELYKAAESFLHATLLAPFWPQLYFDLGTTYLHQENARKALVCFRKADKIAPRGFWSTKTAIYTLQREEKGLYAPGTYMLFLSLTIEDEPDRKKQIAWKILESSPHFAPAWTELVPLAESKREQMSYINKGLDCPADTDTRGFLFIQKALVLYTSGHREEALEILSGVIHEPDCTLCNEKKAKMLLSGWLS